MTNALDADGLGSPFEKLGALGLGCPAHLSLSKYLDALVAERVVSRAVADAYTETHYSVAYGGGDPGAAEEPTRALAQELSEVAGLTPATCERLRDLFRPPPTAPTTEPSGAAVLTMPPAAESSAVEPVTSAAPARSRARPSKLRSLLTRRRIKVVACSALAGIWSLAMVTIGYWARAPIARALDELSYALGRPRQAKSLDERLAELRAQAGRAPESPEAWRRYAQLARDQGRPAEALLAFYHLLARYPQDAELLNEAAWLLCTTPNTSVRDPVQALALAERAYAISQSPAITDTLAEAAFQNGQAQRAIRLEENAVGRVTSDQEKAFYEQQLRKFQGG